MPPKKKEDSSKATAAADAMEPDDGADRELVEKELVIGYLKSKLGRYQEHGDQLQIENIKLTEDLENQKLNLRDINEFLTNELKARSLTTSALESKVYELNNIVEDLKRVHEAAMAKQCTEKDKEIEGLRSTLAEYEKKARTMQDFLDRKESMEAEVQGLKAELGAKIKDYEHRLTDMDRSHIQDREKWKRELVQKIKETRIQMMKLTDNQLEMTTKRTIMENEQMSIELHYQSRQTEKLVNKNTLLLEENQDLRRQLSLSKQTQEELAQRNNVYQKTIKSLLVKLQEQGSVQDEHGPVVKALEERVADLELAQHLAKLTALEQEQQLQTTQARLAAARAAADAAAAAQDGVLKFLTQCVEDVRSKIVTSAEDNDDDPLASQFGRKSTDDFKPVQLPTSDRHLFSVSITDPADAEDSDGPELAASASTRIPRGTSRRYGSSPSRSTSFTNLKGPQSRASSIAIRSGPVAPELTVASGRMEDLSLEQRERVLGYLLDKLQAFTHQQLLAMAEGTVGQQQLMAQASSHSARFGRRASSRAAGAYNNDSAPSTHRSYGDQMAARKSTMMMRPNPSGRVTSLGSAPVVLHADLAGSTSSPSASWPAPAREPEPVQQLPSQPELQAAGDAVVLPGALQPISAVSPRTAAKALQQHTPRQPGQPLATDTPQLPMPAVDDLLAQVMADVRPWGKKANDSMSVGGPIAAARGGGVFLKKPAHNKGSPRS